MLRIFETELQGLVRQSAHSVRLHVSTADGVRVTDILNDFEKEAPGIFILPNLIAGSPLEIVVRLEVPKSVKADNLATFDLNFVNQDTGIADSISSVFAREFDNRKAVKALKENADVVRAVQLLMNARARREAMSQMDAGDYMAASATMDAALGSTNILFCRAPSLELNEEISSLRISAEALMDRKKDALSRKQMAYSRESRRKGR